MKPILSAKPPPVPTRMRLVRAPRAQGSSPPPPMGMSAFSVDGDAPAVCIELGPAGNARSARERAAEIAAELPEPASLPKEALVVLLGDASPTGGFVMRLLKRDREPISRAVRATALLARGYVGLGAARDEASGHDLVWGFTSPSS